MKKGFSIVEVAIVVGVIGIIIAMIVEGSSLVDSAKLKAEVQKIYKFETAFGSFYTQYDRMPGSVAINGAPAYSPKAIYEDLTRAGLVQDSDFNANYIKGFWSFYGCNDALINMGVDDKTPPKGSYWSPAPMDTSQSICLIGVYQNPRKDTRVTQDYATNNTAISTRFACFADSMMDDRNFYFGKGRQNMKNSLAYQNMLQNCDKYADSAGGSLGAYMFRIF